MGSRLGSLSVLTYMILGLIGLPIFSEGGGIGYVFKPSFGYIIGFCVGTFVTGWLVEHMKKKTIGHYLIANLAGLFFVYALGMIYRSGTTVFVLLCTGSAGRYLPEHSWSCHRAQSQTIFKKCIVNPFAEGKFYMG